MKETVLFLRGRGLALALAAALLLALSGCGEQPKVSVSKTVSAAGVEDEITFSNLAMQKEQDTTTVFGEVHNGTGERCSFDVKISFFNKSRKLVGTAAGVVNGLNGGQSRVFTAIAAGNYLGASACTAEVESIDSLEENKKSPVLFSGLSSVTVGNSTRIEGTAKNKSGGTRSFTIIAGFYDRSGNLVGVASGAVTDLAAGKSASFTAYGSGDFSDAAFFRVYLDTVVA